MRDSTERLKDIAEAIEKIKAKTKDVARLEFHNDEMLQVWVVYHLQVIGEAVRSLPETQIENYPDIPWREIADMRNLLVHEYFRIDPQIVWNVLENDLRPLEDAITEILGD